LRTRAAFLLELALHLGECHDLFLQGGTKFLDLLGILLGLGLPGSRPFEGHTILQELGLCLGKGRPLLCQHDLNLNKGITRLLQLVARRRQCLLLHLEHGLHLLSLLGLLCWVV
jgi:hypothetical protein